MTPHDWRYPSPEERQYIVDTLNKWAADRGHSCFGDWARQQWALVNAKHTANGQMNTVISSCKPAQWLTIDDEPRPFGRAASVPGGPVGLSDPQPQPERESV